MSRHGAARGEARPDLPAAGGCARLASVLALVLILTPLLWLGRHRPQAAAAALARWRIALYFLAIGFAFLFVEIASIQRFVLFLGHPVYAILVVLCAFLFFAGLGTGDSQEGKP